MSNSNHAIYEKIKRVMGRAQCVWSDVSELCVEVANHCLANKRSFNNVEYGSNMLIKADNAVLLKCWKTAMRQMTGCKYEELDDGTVKVTSDKDYWTKQQGDKADEAMQLCETKGLANWKPKRTVKSDKTEVIKTEAQLMAKSYNLVHNELIKNKDLRNYAEEVDREIAQFIATKLIEMDQRLTALGQTAVSKMVGELSSQVLSDEPVEEAA